MLGIKELIIMLAFQDNRDWVNLGSPVYHID